MYAIPEDINSKLFLTTHMTAVTSRSYQHDEIHEHRTKQTLPRYKFHPLMGFWY